MAPKRTKAELEQAHNDLVRRNNVNELALYFSTVFKPDATFKATITRDVDDLEIEIRLYEAHRADSGVAVVIEQSAGDQVPHVHAHYCMDLHQIGTDAALVDNYEIADIYRQAATRANRIAVDYFERCKAVR